MRAKRNLIASYLFIVLNIVINLLVVRIIVGHYGDRTYGLVVLAFAFITYIESLNLGVYLTNRTLIPLKGSYSSGVLAIASFKYLFKFSALLLIVFVSIYLPFGDKLLPLIMSDHDPGFLNIAKQIIFLSTLYGFFKIPLSLVLSTFAGHDLVSVEKKYNACQQIAKITSLLLAVWLGMSIVWYFLLFTTFSLGVLIVANIHYYSIYVSKWGPRYLKRSKSISWQFITARSFKFFIYTLSTIVVWSTDSLLVSIFYTPVMVANYQINFSIFNAAFLFITAIAGALVANYGNLIKQADFVELQFKMNLSLYGALITALSIGVGGIFFSSDIINIWVGKGHYLGPELILAFSFFGVTIAFSSVINALLSLIADSRVIMLMAVSEGVLNLALSLMLIKFFGFQGIAIATGIASLCTVVIPGILLTKKCFGGKVFVEYKQLLIQLVIAVIVVALVKTQGDKDFLTKIVIYFSYLAFVVLATFILRREYFFSAIRLFKFRS